MKEQLTESQTQGTEATSEAAPAESHRLPLAVYHQTVRVHPGDAPALCALLDQYPALTQQILAVASSHAGMATVRQAIDLHRQGGKPSLEKDYRAGGEMELEGGPPSAASKPSLEKDYRPGGEMELEGGPSSAKPAKPSLEKDYRPGGEMELEGGPPSAKPAKPSIEKDYRPGGEMELESAKPAKPSLEKDYRPGGEMELEGSTPTAPARAEPAWVAHARKYNAANSTLADEFNELTDYTCSDDGNVLNPIDVASWQRHHGVSADGMVGPQTVAAARANSARNASRVASNIQATQGDARPPV